MFRTLLFYAGLYLSTILFTLIGLVVYPLPFQKRSSIMARFAWFNLWWLKLTCNLDWEIEGEEHIPEGPAIIMCKHQSAWETLALQKIFPPQVWVLKRELLWIPFFGWGLASLDPIAINRGSGRKALQQLIEQGTERLNSGHWVVIFPEGTRVAPGEKHRYRVGGASLAVKSGYPVIPVAHNAGEFWARNQMQKKPGTIKVKIGPVIDPEGMDAAQLIQQVEAWIEPNSESLSTLPTAGA